MRLGNKERIEGISVVRGIEGIIASALTNQPKLFNGSGSGTQMPYHITTTSPSHLYHVPTTSPCTSHSIIHINSASSFIQGVTHYIATNKVDFSRKRKVHFFAIFSCDACCISGHFHHGAILFPPPLTLPPLRYGKIRCGAILKILVSVIESESSGQ